MSDALDLMPLPERARRYRELSSRALQDALDSPPGRMRDGYVSLALGWASLAENCEKLIEEEANKVAAKPDAEAAPSELPEQAAQSAMPDISIAALKKPLDAEPNPES